MVPSFNLHLSPLILRSEKTVFDRHPEIQVYLIKKSEYFMSITISENLLYLTISVLNLRYVKVIVIMYYKTLNIIGTEGLK